MKEGKPPEDSLPVEGSATAADSSSAIISQPIAEENEATKWSRATMSVAKHTNPVLGC
ncbi:MAG: hypothetical protein WCT37_05380 [Patescibacteria group bacterium]|jgi:hypothetical protein